MTYKCDICNEVSKPKEVCFNYKNIKYLCESCFKLVKEQEKKQEEKENAKNTT